MEISAVEGESVRVTEGERQGKPFVGAQNAAPMALFASPAPRNICARHALRVRGGRGRNQAARCSQHKQGARQASAREITKFHGR